uniref:LIM zinc-binding domain-containing protein n=1 Tax=Megaselia scalaris TaxID=36166 RepID=T1GVQ3_MEGSC
MGFYMSNWLVITHKLCFMGFWGCVTGRDASLVPLYRLWEIDLKYFIMTELRSCAACGKPISDRYFLEVGGCSWHGSCLTCCVCLSPLDREQSCFIRERQVYCKNDYANF